MFKFQSAYLVGVLCLGLGNVQAQSSPPAPRNQVQLSASGAVEVQQDWLTITMSTQRDATDALTVQTQLKQALDAALSEAKKAVVAGQLELRTGNFSLYPRYGRDGKINGWQGGTELVLEGRDFAHISATAGKIQTLTLGQVTFRLSRERKDQVEGEAQAQAIARFKTKAQDVAQAFGWSGYTLGEIAINTGGDAESFQPRAVMMSAKAVASDAPVPVEAGRSTVQVTVSGTVQLR